MNQESGVISVGRILPPGFRGRVIITIFALVALAFLAYREALSSLILNVLYREHSSHGLFVPFISGYFLWTNWDSIRQEEVEFAWLPGGAMVMAGLLVLYFSQGSTMVALPALSFIIVSCGLVICLLGSRMFKKLSFPLLFLITMIPLPEELYLLIAEWMRLATTSGSVWLMKLIQLPVYRDGYNIQLPNAVLYIARSCSGIRYLLSYFVLGLAYAFLFKRSIRSRTLVALATLPIALTAGVLRLSSIYLSVYYVGAFMAKHLPHIFMSWLVFLGVLVLAIWLDRSL